MTYAVTNKQGTIQVRCLPSMSAAKKIAAQTPGFKAIVDPRSIQR